ncbi:MAG: hypothetical protein JNL08_13985 [Planctomycetes bacterium]|nr:hypothetical protein [Planctomycetota bacterium]
MDPGAFVQENKKWLIGVAIGGVVYLVASAVLGSIYDAEGARREQRNLLRQAGGTPLYDSAALTAAKTEAEQLQAERQRLQQELAFVPQAKYELAGQGAADEYLFQVGRALKQAVLNAAAERDVQIADKDVVWEVPTGVDEIRGVLFGLELLDEFTQRLYAAHDATRAANPEAPGLRAVGSLRVEPRRGQRSAARATRPGDVDLRDLLVQERVSFQFQADEPTCQRVLESCRKPGRTLVLESWQIQAPARLGEPCSVKGTLQGIAFKDRE